MKKSVVIAYYNGINYIKEQMDSIRTQLDEQDEILISIDAASDGSRTLLEQLAHEDHRIQLLEGPGKGVVKNFEFALTKCKGEVIFIADQDDVWREDKVKRVCQAFSNPKTVAVVHNAQIVDGNLKTLGETTFSWRDSGAGFWKNVKKNSYIGCCMAIRKSILSYVLPIPKQVFMHDQWIGLLAEQLGKVVFLEEPLLFYRRHGENVTELSHGSLVSMIKKRYHMVIEVNKRVRQWKRKEDN